MAYLKPRKYVGMPAVLEQYRHLVDKPGGCRVMAEMMRQGGNDGKADDLDRWADHLESQGD